MYTEYFRSISRKKRILPLHLITKACQSLRQLILQKSEKKRKNEEVSSVLFISISEQMEIEVRHEPVRPKGLYLKDRLHLKQTSGLPSY